MITSIKDLTKELEKLSYSIEQVLKQSSYSEYDDLSGLEVLIYDDFEERYSWVASRIEHNGQDYYIVGLRDTKLEGLKARIRERS